MDSQNDKHDKGDEAMNDEVEVYKIILYIVRFKTKRICLDLYKCSVFFVACIVFTFFHTG